MKAKALMSWSSGKDSAHALCEAQRTSELEIVGLITTVTAAFDRIAMHGVRRELLAQQATALGLPLFTVEIPARCSNETYEQTFGDALRRARADGITHVAFGDLFLEDVRSYRETQLDALGMTAAFPLWGRDTRALAHEMLASGISARLTCIDPRHLDRSFAGRVFDASLVDELPANVDPCGERGEFHTFVTHSPGFAQPVEVTLGEIVERDGFVFADLVQRC